MAKAFNPPFNNEVKIPTIKTWDAVDEAIRNGTLKKGDILPDGSTILFDSRGHSLDEAANFELKNVELEYPNTPKDMSNMRQVFIQGKYKEDDIKGDLAKKNEWFREWKKDLNNPPNEKKRYVNTLKGT